MILHQQFTRKEFLAWVGTLFGTLLLSRVSFGRSTSRFATQHSASYGNGTYGGTART